MRKQVKNTKGSLFDLILVMLGIVFLIPWLMGYIVIKGNDTTQQVPDARESIRVEVLNGCGVEGIAADFATFLRKHGVDVLAPENAASFGYPKTLILDRTGNQTEADSIAKLLGVPQKQIMLQRKDGIVDATLIIGRDFSNYNVGK